MQEKSSRGIVPWWRGRAPTAAWCTTPSMLSSLYAHSAAIMSAIEGPAAVEEWFAGWRINHPEAAAVELGPNSSTSCWLNRRRVAVVKQPSP